jgi:hypothetical protein
MTTVSVTVLAAIALALGCGTSTKLVGVWRDPTYTGKPIASAMVIGVARGEDNRKFFENEVAARLRGHGVRSVTSYSVLPAGELTRDQIVAAVKDAGVEAVLLTRVKNVDTTSTFVEGSSYVVPEAYYNGYYNYYYQTYRTVNEPGYEEQSLTVLLENNLYAVSGEKLLWSATSETFDPQSITDAVASIASAIVEDLKRQGLVPR